MALADPASPVARALANEARDEIGKTYWVRGGTATNRVFCDGPDFPETRCPGKLFGPDLSERFVIEAAGSDRPVSRGALWFRVRFDSGRIAYLNADTLRTYLFVPLRYTPGQIDPSRPIYELFFTEPPHVAITRVFQQVYAQHDEAVREENERLAHGGVQVGMTGQQVLNSAWGAPLRTRRNPFAGRVREQWIYPNGDELLFEYGRVVGIRSRR